MKLLRERVPPKLRGTLAAASGGGALFGFAIAAALWNDFYRPATVHQLPGFARANNFSPANDLHRLVAFILLSGAGALVCRFLARRSAGQNGRLAHFARPAPWWGLGLVSILFATAGEPWGLAAAAGIAAALFLAWLGDQLAGALRLRNPAAAAIVAHALLAWTFLAGPLSVLGIAPLLLAFALILVSLATARWLGSGDLDRGARYLAAAAIVFPVAFWRTRPEKACWGATIAVLLAPLLARLLLPGAEKFWKRATAFFLLPVAVASLSAGVLLRRPPQANLFEDGHWLGLASQYLRGKLPYRDVVPGHGLFSDGLLQAAEMKVFGVGYHGYARGSRLVGAIYWPLIFAAGVAASGSAALGFWAALATFLIEPTYFFWRLAMALLVLIVVSLAARKKRRWLWVASGALLPLALLWANDFAFYAGAAAAAAVCVSRGNRWKNLAWFTAGGAVMFAAICAFFAAIGVLGQFLWVTFRYIPGLFPVYAMGFPAKTTIFATHVLPDVLADLLRPEAFIFWFLIFALLAGAALLARLPTPGARGRALAPFLAFYIALNLSVVERWHVQYPLYMAPMAAVLAAWWLWGHRKSGVAGKVVAGVILAALVIAMRPVGRARGFSIALANVLTDKDAVYPSSPSRAAGVGWAQPSYRTVREAGEFLRDQHFGPSDTWFDFSNTALLYFLYDRDMPVRYYEVAFYEKPAQQEEVIRALETNPHVRAVLLHASDTLTDIDKISPAERAPLVWGYIQQHFHKVPSGPDVVFWMRNAGG